MPARDIVFLILFFAALPVCLFRPFFGILMWTIVSLLNPHAFMWQMTYSFPWAVYVAVPTLVGTVLFERNWKHLSSGIIFTIVILWVWFTVTTVRNTQIPEFMHFAADTWHRWGIVSKILLMTFVTAGVVNTRARLRWLLLVIAGCFGILVLKAVPFMILTGGSFRLYGPRGSMLDDNNDLGLALNMTLPIFFFLASTEADRRIRWLMTLLFVATIPAIFFTYSRGALIGLAVVLLLMIMRSRRRLVLFPILLLAALFAVFLTPARWQHRMDFSREGALIDDSARSRFNAWTYSWNLANDYPLTGAGFDAFTPALFNRYAPDPKDVHGPHSIYFGVLAEHGFIGLFLYLCLLASCFVTLRQIIRYARSRDDRVIASYAGMMQFSLAGFMVSGAFLGRAYFDYYLTIVACIVVLKRLCRFDAATLVPSTATEEEPCGVASEALISGEK